MTATQRDKQNAHIYNWIKKLRADMIEAAANNDAVWMEKIAARIAGLKAELAFGCLD